MSFHSLIYAAASEYQFPGLLLFRKVRKNSAETEHRLPTFSVNDLVLNIIKLHRMALASRFKVLPL